MKFAELQRIYHQPFFDLLKQARAVCEAHWPEREIQLCTLLSIKTGGCSEDCSYCSQSAHYSTGVNSEPLMARNAILEQAKAAREAGSSRFCMGAAWKGISEGTPRFEQILEIVRDVAQIGIEVCVTLGELGAEEARQLRAAGLTTYNHNIDTSPEHYPKIVSTHTYQDRLDTIRHVQDAGINVCCGGILGVGETIDDRLRMLEVLSEFNPPPESVPINRLMPMPGTPLEAVEPVDTFDLVRMIATTRIAVPRAKVRLSAGRSCLSEEAQALCFFAGANSIFFGEKLLTADNPAAQADLALLRKLDLLPLTPQPGLQAPAASQDLKRQPALP